MLQLILGYVLALQVVYGAQQQPLSRAQRDAIARAEHLPLLGLSTQQILTRPINGFQGFTQRQGFDLQDIHNKILRQQQVTSIAFLDGDQLLKLFCLDNKLMETFLTHPRLNRVFWIFLVCIEKMKWIQKHTGLTVAQVERKLEALQRHDRVFLDCRVTNCRQNEERDFGLMSTWQEWLTPDQVEYFNKEAVDDRIRIASIKLASMMPHILRWIIVSTDDCMTMGRQGVADKNYYWGQPLYETLQGIVAVHGRGAEVVPLRTKQYGGLRHRGFDETLKAWTGWHNYGNHNCGCGLPTPQVMHVGIRNALQAYNAAAAGRGATVIPGKAKEFITETVYNNFFHTERFIQDILTRSFADCKRQQDADIHNQLIGKTVVQETAAQKAQRAADQRAQKAAQFASDQQYNMIKKALGSLGAGKRFSDVAAVAANANDSREFLDQVKRLLPTIQSPRLRRNLSGKDIYRAMHKQNSEQAKNLEVQDLNSMLKAARQEVSRLSKVQCSPTVFQQAQDRCTALKAEMKRLRAEIGQLKKRGAQWDQDAEAAAARISSAEASETLWRQSGFWHIHRRKSSPQSAMNRLTQGMTGLNVAPS
jgi:hypothetical protein